MRTVEGESMDIQDFRGRATHFSDVGQTFRDIGLTKFTLNYVH